MLARPGRTIYVVALAVLAPFAALVLRGFWSSEGHGAPLTQLARVRPGMTRGGVVALLGNPGTINRASDGSESWFNTRYTWCQVKVYISSEGLVSETGHDH
jgi:outer membrane protein assembly factor BamE (lipoprotein component of BamABCDE complex)